MNARHFVLCLAPLAMGACGSSENDTGDAPDGMSGAEIAAAMEGAVRPLPGQYSTKVTLIDIDMPGMPAEQVEQMKGMMQGAMEQANSYCLTEEEAEEGYEEMAKNAGENCAIESFSVDGGDIAGRLTCKENGSEGVMSITGTGTETGSDMTMDMAMTSADLPGGSMAMKMRVVSTRTGDCES